MGLKLEQERPGSKARLELELIEPRTKDPWRESRRTGKRRTIAALAGGGKAWIVEDKLSIKEGKCLQMRFPWSALLFKGKMNYGPGIHSEVQRHWRELEVHHSPPDVTYSILPFLTLIVLICRLAW